jgi:hypothetical protein
MEKRQMPPLSTWDIIENITDMVQEIQDLLPLNNGSGQASVPTKEKNIRADTGAKKRHPSREIFTSPR